VQTIRTRLRHQRVIPQEQPFPSGAAGKQGIRVKEYVTNR
jgi:uncharacterized oligopeptide transporter (OPT) family protein